MVRINFLILLFRLEIIKILLNLHNKSKVKSIATLDLFTLLSHNAGIMGFGPDFGPAAYQMYHWHGPILVFTGVAIRFLKKGLAKNR